MADKNDKTVSSREVQILEERMSLAQYEKLKSVVGLLESIPDFAKDSDESQWTSLDDRRGIKSLDDLMTMCEQADRLYYTDPSARGIIDNMVNFIVGKDATISPVDEDETVAEYWRTFCLVNKLDERMKEYVSRALRHGEVFLRFFPADEEAEYIDDMPVNIPVPCIRFIHPSHIRDPHNSENQGIVTDPDDVEKVITYKLCRDGQTSIDIAAKEMIHTKILVDSDIKRGISFLMGLSKYIVKYSQWLDDRIVLNRIRTLFNLIMKVSGNPTEMSKKFEDSNKTATTSKGTSMDSIAKKMPKRGGMMVSTPNIEYEFANLNIRAQDTKDDGRSIELMLSKGTGLTEYIIRGDASNANYSSSMVSESPMVRALEAWQDLFAKPFKQIYRKVIRMGIEAGSIPAVTEKTKAEYDEKTQTEKLIKEMGPTSYECDVTFEALIHRNIKDEADAYQIYAQNRWMSNAEIIRKLGGDPEKTFRALLIEDMRRVAQEKRLSDTMYEREQQNKNKNKDESGESEEDSNKSDIETQGDNE